MAYPSWLGRLPGFGDGDGIRFLDRRIGFEFRGECRICEAFQDGGPQYLLGRQIPPHYLIVFLQYERLLHPPTRDFERRPRIAPMRDVGSMLPNRARIRSGESNVKLIGQLRRPTYELCSRACSVTGNPDMDERIHT